MQKQNFLDSFARGKLCRPLRLFRLCGKFVIFLSLIIFISCVSVSPLSSEERTVTDFSFIENIEAHWRTYADGIDFLKGRIASPRIDFWALRINLNSPNIEIVCGANNDNATVSGFVRNNNLAVGINAVPFNASGKNLGIVISGGETLSPAHPYYDALVFYRQQGKAEIVKQTSIKSTENILNAIGGFYQILADGEAAQRTLNTQARHPRSAAGVSKDGGFLYLLVIDGRRAGSIGSTERETAMILHSLGSWNGLNFDGGGSSALVMRFPDGIVKAVNIPIHNGIQGMERSVAGCLAVNLSTEK